MHSESARVGCAQCVLVFQWLYPVLCILFAISTYASFSMLKLKSLHDRICRTTCVGLLDSVSETGHMPCCTGSVPGGSTQALAVTLICIQADLMVCIVWAHILSILCLVGAHTLSMLSLACPVLVHLLTAVPLPMHWV